MHLLLRLPSSLSCIIHTPSLGDHSSQEMRLTHCPILMIGSLWIFLSTFFPLNAWFHTPTDIYNMLYLSTIILQWYFVEALTVVALSWVAITVSNLVAFSHSGVLVSNSIPSLPFHDGLLCVVTGTKSDCRNELWQTSTVNRTFHIIAGIITTMITGLYAK